MSQRKQTHNGRDTDGNYRVKQADVDDKQTDPDGVEHLQDDVRLGGAVADTGPDAGGRGVRIGDLAEANREDVDRLVGRDREGEHS